MRACVCGGGGQQFRSAANMFVSVEDGNSHLGVTLEVEERERVCGGTMAIRIHAGTRRKTHRNFTF